MSGPSARDPGDTARRLAVLSGRMVALAQLLAAAERTVAEVRTELEDLGLAGQLDDHLASLSLPAAAAERLMDDLDQLAGEAHNAAVGRAAAAGGAGGAGVDRLLELLRRAQPFDGRLMVKCQACGVHFESPLAVDGGALDGLEDCRYRCPQCGAEGLYETWDHFLTRPGPP